MKGKVFTNPAGEQFTVFSGKELNEIGGLFQFDDDAEVHIPNLPPDDKLEFPSIPPFNDYAFVATSGVIKHSIRRKEVYGPTSPPKLVETPDGVRVKDSKGFSATSLSVFVEIDWFGECYQVMDAHGWLDGRGNLAQHIVDLVSRKISPCEIAKAKISYGENWEARVAEIAASEFVQPLSRLWYAVNMQALYYCHHDDILLGYLWAEYQMRLNIERNALRGEGVVKNAREGGIARGNETSSVSCKVIAAMEDKIASGKSISNAARLAFKAGLGSSPDANRKLWTRRRSKYLGHCPPMSQTT